MKKNKTLAQLKNLKVDSFITTSHIKGGWWWGTGYISEYCNTPSGDEPPPKK